MAANMSNLSSAVSLVDISSVANNVTDGWLGLWILLGTFSIMFVSLKGFRTPAAVVPAMIFTWLVSTFLLFIGLVNDGTVLVTTILMALSLLAVAFIRN